MISPENIWNLLWVNENVTLYSGSQVFPLAGGIFPLFPDCREKYEIMEPKLETRRLSFSLVRFIKLLAQELEERIKSVLILAVSEQGNSAQIRRLTGMLGWAVPCLGASCVWDRKGKLPGSISCYLKAVKTLRKSS